MSLTIVTRAEWGARPPKNPPFVISIPTPKLWLHHTASPSGGASRIRAIQDFHMDERGWNDIAYSFLINHEGTIYEGRGAGVAGGHTAGQNTVSHAICLLGNFDTTQPTDQAIASTVALTRHGFAEGWWPQIFTGGHRDAPGANTSCPGNNLYSRLAAINEAILEEDVNVAELIREIQTAINRTPVTPKLNVNGVWDEQTANRFVTALQLGTGSGSGLTEAEVKAIVAATKLQP